jgi:hypothetical protein
MVALIEGDLTFTERFSYLLEFAIPLQGGAHPCHRDAVDDEIRSPPPGPLQPWLVSLSTRMTRLRMNSYVLLHWPSGL